MATHSSVLAWRIPGTGSLVGCRLWGRTESDTTEATQQQQQLTSTGGYSCGTRSLKVLPLDHDAKPPFLTNPVISVNEVSDQPCSLSSSSAPT